MKLEDIIILKKKNLQNSKIIKLFKKKYFKLYRT